MGVDVFLHPVESRKEVSFGKCSADFGLFLSGLEKLSRVDIA